MFVDSFIKQLWLERSLFFCKLKHVHNSANVLKVLIGEGKQNKAELSNLWTTNLSLTFLQVVHSGRACRLPNRKT
jgi:hypothetical protein